MRVDVDAAAAAAAVAILDEAGLARAAISRVSLEAPVIIVLSFI